MKILEETNLIKFEEAIDKKYRDLNYLRTTHIDEFVKGLYPVLRDWFSKTTKSTKIKEEQNLLNIDFVALKMVEPKTSEMPPISYYGEDENVEVEKINRLKKAVLFRENIEKDINITQLIFSEAASEINNSFFSLNFSHQSFDLVETGKKMKDLPYLFLENNKISEVFQNYQDGQEIDLKVEAEVVKNEFYQRVREIIEKNKEETYKEECENIFLSKLLLEDNKLIIFKSTSVKFFGKEKPLGLIMQFSVDENVLSEYKDSQLYTIFRRIFVYTVEFEKASIKSAISAIMSRNMSHNLGSHVFFYTRQELNKLEDNFKVLREKKIIEEDYQERRIKGLSWFLHYVQERQDFIANINSSEQYPVSSLNLKQDVFDECTPDAVDIRHNSNPPTWNFLLDNIVKSEHIRVFDKNNPENQKIYKNLELLLRYKGEKECLSLSSIAKSSEKVPEKLYDIDLAVKAGQQSRHAFLIILENIIRNSAKHGARYLKENKLQITIDVTKEENAYKIEIYDNCKNEKEALEILQKKKRDIKLIDNLGGVNRESKGLKEIIICILWLLGDDISRIEEKKDEVLKLDKKDGNIVYQFSLPAHNKIIDLKDYKDKYKDKYAYAFTYHYDNGNQSEEDGDKYCKKYPRFIKNFNGDKNFCWKQIFEQHNPQFKDKQEELPILIFDRGRYNCNIQNKVFLGEKCLEFDKVKNFLSEKNKQVLTFKNHCGANEKSLEDLFKTPLKTENWLVDNLSGGNQTFILFNKFFNNVDVFTKEEERDISNFNDLYYHILDNYYAKTVIIDERLSFAKININKEQVSQQDIDCFFENNDLKDFEAIQNFVESFLSNDDVINEMYNIWENTEDKKDCLDTLKGIVLENIDNSKDETNSKSDNSQNVKEKFYEHQNTCLFNYNIKENKLVNSKGVETATKTFFKDVMFFSIHIGILDKIKFSDNEIFEVINNGKLEEEDIRYLLSHIEKNKEKIDEFIEDKEVKERLKNIQLDNKREVTSLFKLKMLKWLFNISNSTYISVHSGRGGLNEENDKITFIPFANLQWALEDSKYALSELFFNNTYEFI